MSSAFRDRELSRLEESGWVANPRIQALVEDSLLPPPHEALVTFMDAERWACAEHVAAQMREHFGGFRFAETVHYGILLVPSPARLDTRGAISPAVRKTQHSGLGADFVNPALGSGVDLSVSSLAWTPFVSVVDEYGISAGSHDDIAASPADQFEVDGFDTRRTMTRQLWGARLLQAPPGRIPDSDYNDTWTFTLFPGEPLVDDQVVSGTVLKGKVRFRLGKRNRGIGSARISPAVPLT